jgi:xanthine dehydrogenase large subunit
MSVELPNPGVLPALGLTKPAKADSVLHQDALHESGLKHATGEALYVDDLPHPPGMLVGLVVASPHAHARIVSRDASEARRVPGVRAVYFAADIPGENELGTVVHDEPLLATSDVRCVGQAVAFIAADSYAAARAAAKLVRVEYEPLPAILTIAQAIEARSFLAPPHVIARGDVEAALAGAHLKLVGEAHNGGQDHFYLETQATLAVPSEGALHLYCSTQHPSEVQATVAHVLGIGRNQVVVEVPRMGGGFGGKETQAAPFAALASLAALKLKRPVKVWLNRDQDMAQTGKRHPFWSKYEAGFDAEGHLVALKVEMYSDGGFSNDLSRSILDRGLFHLDNAYFIPALRFVGQPCRTNLPSNTAFRGFGGPQGMVVVEEVLNRAAEVLGLDGAEIRARNYYGEAPRNRTPYDQLIPVEENRSARIHAELLASSDYEKRRRDIAAFNAQSPNLKRGLGFMPVKFGISFTASFLNQAGAFALIYADGSLQLNHGGTEMGQGLHTKMITIVSHVLGIGPERIRAMNTATDKVPNTSATAASSGADLNGMAVQIACETLRERLRPVAAGLLQASNPDEIVFARGRVAAGERSVAFAEVAQAAYMSQVQLSATGYYRTPDIAYDKEKGRGKPFHYFAYGAALTEVEVSGLTGEHRVTRVDVLHDVGASLVPSIDRGQVEGAYIQGLGWLTCEEVLFNPKGVLLTHSPDTYKVPALGEAPEDFRVALLQRAPQHNTIHGSKAVGEPPLMLAIGVIAALRDAIRGFNPDRHADLKVPCTPESVLMAVESVRG